MENSVFFLLICLKKEQGIFTLNRNQIQVIDPIRLEIIKMYKDGVSQKEIKKTYGEFGNWVIKCYRREVIDAYSGYKLSSKFFI